MKPKILDVLDQSKEPIIRIIKLVMFACSTVIILVMFTLVLCRYVIPGAPMIWVEEIIILFALWLYFLGSAYATSRGEQIGGGFIDMWLSGVKLKIIRIIAKVIDLSVVALFLYLSVKYFIYLFNSSKSSLYLGINKSLWEASLVVGFTLMLIFITISIGNDIYEIDKKEDKK